MSKPQPSVSLHFGKEWKIRRPLIYRYLDSKYVNDFFERGVLRLSSFSAFSQHADEQRRDEQEGIGLIENVNIEGEGPYICAAISQGQNAFVLCGSTRYHNSLMTAFETNSGFRIDDTVGFAESISRYVPGFHAGIEGPCIYVANRVLRRDMARGNPDFFTTANASNNINEKDISGLVWQMVGDDYMFVKSNHYEHQNEYRLLWGTPAAIDADYIEIKCPEARQYCTSFDHIFSEL